MSKKKKVVLAARLDSLLQQTCMALFLNIFIVTSNSSVSIYRSICSCSHCFSSLLQGTTCGKADHPWQPYLVRGTIYGNIICRRWSGGPVVVGDQLRRDRSTISRNGLDRTGLNQIHKLFYGTDRTNECICAHAESMLSRVYDGSALVRLVLDIK